jgi:hypothetical protein
MPRSHLGEIIKEFEILAKGHNETYEIVNPMKHTRTATNVIGAHVSENGGTCLFAFLLTVRAKASGDEDTKSRQSTTQDLPFESFPCSFQCSCCLV